MNISEFENPGALYRNAPFWSWNDKLDKDELKRQIQEMADKGWGSYFMHSRVGLVTGYLSDEWMEMIEECAQKARETGTYAWLYDEDKWPSGFAGGEVPEMDERYRSRALVLLKEDQITANDEVLKEFEEDSVTYCICKRISSLGNDWFNGACYVDLMNPEAVKAFIDCTHERYKEACGQYFGKEIPGIFTDEPCYLMYGHYNVPALVWSEYLPDFFKELKGYSILEHLPELFFDTGDYKKVRFDFYDSSTRLFIQSFTKQYYEWCDKNNLKMTGHFMCEDTHISQTQWIGAAMPHYEFMHWPGIDKLGRHVEQHVTVKQVSSAADQLGKERAFCEVFGCVGQQVSFYHRKWIGDWQAALGISFVNSHLSLYSMRGERKRDYPANLYYQQPWWEDEKKYADYTSRLCYAVSSGKRDVDILILHTISSAWCDYTPLHRYNNFMVENEIYSKPLNELAYKLAANKLDYHFGDEIIMERHARVENGKLIVGQHEYSTIVIPPSLTLRSNTVRLLQEFAKEAGPDRIIFIGKLPERIDGSKCSLNLSPGIKKAVSTGETVNIIDSYYPERLKVTDVVTGRNADSIICNTRINGSEKLVFIANTDEKREVNACISLPGTVIPVVLDLMTGDAYKINAQIKDGRVCINLKFYPAGSIVLYFPDNMIDVKEAPAFLNSGVELENRAGTSCIIKDFKIDFLENNILPLSNITLYLDGEKVLDNKHVAMAWHNHFYKAADGTPFKAEYHFEVDTIPEGEIFAAVECAENLDSITINGNPVKVLKERGELGAFDPLKSWKDISFTKVPLDGLLVKGINTLVLEGKKVNNITNPGCHSRVVDFGNHIPTEVETVYIAGNFSVINEDNTRFVIGKKSDISNCEDITASGYPFYAGKAEFTAGYEHNDSGKKVYLKVNNVEAACIELYVNGKCVDVKYWKPYVFDITEYLENGRNDLKITAATTLFNLTGPNWISDITDKKGIGPGTFVNMDEFTEKYELLPFGIQSISIMEE